MQKQKFHSWVRGDCLSGGVRSGRASFAPHRKRPAKHAEFTGTAEFLKRHPAQRIQLRLVPLSNLDIRAAFLLRRKHFQDSQYQGTINALAAKLRKYEEVKQMDIISSQRKKIRFNRASIQRPSVTRKVISRLCEPQGGTPLEALGNQALHDFWIPEIYYLQQVPSGHRLRYRVPLDSQGVPVRQVGGFPRSKITAEQHHFASGRHPPDREERPFKRRPNPMASSIFDDATCQILQMHCSRAVVHPSPHFQFVS